jgi:hypothetical protein
MFPILLLEKKLPTEAEVEAEDNNAEAIGKMLESIEEDLQESVLLNCCQIPDSVFDRVQNFVWLSTF